MGSRTDNQLFRHEKNSLNVPAGPGAGRRTAEKPRNGDTSRKAACGPEPIERLNSAQLTRLVRPRKGRTADDAVLTRTLPNLSVLQRDDPKRDALRAQGLQVKP